MADTIRELNVGLTDIAATIRGLKAIQREAKKATQALRELEAAQAYRPPYLWTEKEAAERD